jgi:hypothetical protein
MVLLGNAPAPRLRTGFCSKGDPMRSLTFLLLASGMSCSWMACEPREAAPTGGNAAPGAAASEGVFSSRLEAAKAIFDSTARDEALSKVAVDAAAAGEADVVMKAIQSIFDSALKDEAASQSALKLGKFGKGSEANAAVRLIFDSSLRDKTLAKIAKGEFGE